MADVSGVVLSPEQQIVEHQTTEWVHQEILRALDANGKRYLADNFRRARIERDRQRGKEQRRQQRIESPRFLSRAKARLYQWSDSLWYMVAGWGKDNGDCM